MNKKVTFYFFFLLISNLAYAGIFDGAGSLINSSLDCWGCNKDAAVMHPHPGTVSTVAFQWLYNKQSCHHIDLQSNYDIEILVKQKASRKHFIQKAFKFYLTAGEFISLNKADNNSNWTTLAISSTHPIDKDVYISAFCREPQIHFNEGKRKTIISNDLVNVTDNHYWAGTGSLISKANNRTGNGVNEDIVVTFPKHNSLTSFQWYSSLSCQKLRISDYYNTNSKIKATVSIKSWNLDNSFFKKKCENLPCTINHVGYGYFIIKVVTDAGVIRNGILYAKCEPSSNPSSKDLYFDFSEVLPISGNQKPVADNPSLASCKEIKKLKSNATDGVYTIDPDGKGINKPFKVDCDMTTEGGGWTKIATQRNFESKPQVDLDYNLWSTFPHNQILVKIPNQDKYYVVNNNWNNLQQSVSWHEKKNVRSARISKVHNLDNNTFITFITYRLNGISKNWASFITIGTTTETWCSLGYGRYNGSCRNGNYGGYGNWNVFVR